MVMNPAECLVGYKANFFKRHLLLNNFLPNSPGENRRFKVQHALKSAKESKNKKLGNKANFIVSYFMILLIFCGQVSKAET